MKSKWQRTREFYQRPGTVLCASHGFFQFYFFAFEASDPIQSLFSDEKKNTNRKVMLASMGGSNPKGDLSRVKLSYSELTVHVL